MPMQDFAASSSRSMSWPNTSTWPPVLLTKDVTIPIAVVLPAPLGPSSAKKSPCSTVRAMPLSAWMAFLYVWVSGGSTRACMEPRSLNRARLPPQWQLHRGRELDARQLHALQSLHVCARGCERERTPERHAMTPASAQGGGFRDYEVGYPIDRDCAQGGGGALVHAKREFGRQFRGRCRIPSKEQRETHELRLFGADGGAIGDMPNFRILQPQLPILVIAEAQVEQRVRTVRHGGSLRPRECGDATAERRARPVQFEKTKIQFAQ